MVTLKTKQKDSPAATPERTAVEPGAYGVVYVASGSLAGRTVYYDDDSGERSAIVYLGYPLFSESCTVRFSCLQSATEAEIQAFGEMYMNELAGKRSARK